MNRNIRKLVKKLIPVEKEMAAEKGPFLLFALFMPQHGYGKWDVLVSAPWLDRGVRECWQYITRNIQQAITMEELLKISRVVIIEYDHPDLEEVYEMVDVEHGLAEIKDEVFFEVEIRWAYFITSRRAIQEMADVA